VKSVDAVDVIREAGDLESRVISGLVDASDGGGVHVLVALHVGGFRLFKEHDSIKVAYVTATVGREERCAKVEESVLWSSRAVTVACAALRHVALGLTMAGMRGWIARIALMQDKK
jgi:hypothetical protein